MVARNFCIGMLTAKPATTPNSSPISSPPPQIAMRSWGRTTRQNTRRGDAPSWGTKPFPKGERSGQFVVLASGFDGDKDALPIRTDARIVAATLKAGDSADYPLGVARRAYLVPAKGELEVNGVRLNARDGAAIAQEDVVTVKALSDAEIVLVDAA